MNFLRPQFTIFPQPYVLARNHLCSFLWGKNKKKTKKGFVWSYHHIVLLLNTIYKVNFFLAFLYKGQLTTTRADIHYSQIICQTNGLFRKRAFQIFKQRIFFFWVSRMSSQCCKSCRGNHLLPWKYCTKSPCEQLQRIKSRVNVLLMDVVLLRKS